MEEEMTLQNRWAGVAAALLTVAVSASAQSPAPSRPPQTLPNYLQAQYATLKRNVTGSADKMPAEHFSFKPAPEVMTYAELLTHIGETQYAFCSTVKGTANPGASLNFKVTDKVGVGQLLKDSFAYCDDAFAALTNENVLEMLTRGAAPNQRQLARGNQLTQLIVHGNEHYGNLVTYMRMKGIVPPSSTPATQP
jgi:uncharacterized damage-inducible protein DinB